MNRFGVVDDFQSSPLCLNQLMVKDQNTTYFFRHRGSSMSPWVDEGDLLVVDYSLPPLLKKDLSLFHQKMALVEMEHEFFCRRIKYIKGKLYAYDFVHDPIEIRQDSDSIDSIVGIVTFIIKET